MLRFSCDNYRCKIYTSCWKDNDSDENKSLLSTVDLLTFLKHSLKGASRDMTGNYLRSVVTWWWRANQNYRHSGRRNRSDLDKDVNQKYFFSCKKEKEKRNRWTQSEKFSKVPRKLKKKIHSHSNSSFLYLITRWENYIIFT